MSAVEIEPEALCECVYVKHPEPLYGHDRWIYVTGLIVVDEGVILVQGQEVAMGAILCGPEHFVEFEARVGQLLEAM